MTERICPGCDKPLEGRPNKKYHDNVCKQRAHRKRVDPLIGSDERKRAKLEGFEHKLYAATRKAIRRDLSKADLLPESEAIVGADADQDLRAYYDSRQRKYLLARKRPKYGGRPPGTRLKRIADDLVKREIANDYSLREIRSRARVELLLHLRLRFWERWHREPLAALLRGEPRPPLQPLERLLYAASGEPFFFDILRRSFAFRHHHRERSRWLRIVREFHRARVWVRKEVDRMLDQEIQREAVRLAQASEAVGAALDDSQKHWRDVHAHTVTLQRLLVARYGSDWLERAAANRNATIAV